MTAAFAKALDLTLHYQDVRVEETWSRDGHIYFSIGHVNVTLVDRGFGLNSGETTIDFLPPRDLTKQSRRSIGEKTVIAMYLNNRAVESLVRGGLDDAYWWAARGHRAGTVVRERVQHARGGLTSAAGCRAMPRRCSCRSSGASPGNVHVMSNLVAALNEQGHTGRRTPGRRS
jgi:hypothetical protein